MTWPLVRRIATDYRRVIVPIAALALVNVAGYALGVYPLALQVAGQEARATRVATELAAAEQALEQANDLLEGKRRAESALARFYGDILPADQREARRVTYLQLADMAERANLNFSRRTFAPGQDRGSSIARLDMTMSIDGAYRDMRRFIHAVETAEEFIVINQVALAQRERGAALSLTLQLATYFRASDEP
jgi:Tfp pilus assembly protein PilO